MVSHRLAYWPVAYLIFIEFCERFVSFNQIISKVLLERFFNLRKTKENLSGVNKKSIYVKDENNWLNMANL